MCWWSALVHMNTHKYTPTQKPTHIHKHIRTHMHTHIHTHIHTRTDTHSVVTLGSNSCPHSLAYLLYGLRFDSWPVRMSSMGHFLTDIWFLKNYPHTCPSSWLSEKTPGCQEKHWYSLRAPRNRSDAHLFLLVQMHHTFLEQFTLFKQSSSWESCAGWPSYCKLQIEAIHGLIRFCTHSKISLHLSNFWMPYDLEKLSR